MAEVKVAALAQSKTGRKVVEFSMDVAIKRPREQVEDDSVKPGAKAAVKVAAAGTDTP